MLALADCVFALPRRPRSAALVGAPDGWRESLRVMGTPVRAASEDVDLVVAGRHAADPIPAAESVIVDGRARSRLPLRDYRRRLLLPLPDRERPQLMLPLGAPREIRFALDRSPPSARWKRLRNRAAVAVLGTGVALPGVPAVSVASRLAGPPFLVAAASRALELPADVGWLLQPGGGDAISRGALHLFPTGEAAPAWVLKFARVPGYTESFDQDERGLGIAAAAGEVVARHAPRLVGRFAVDGLHASVETAAPGRSLVGYLGSRLPRERRRQAIDAVAGWIIEMGLASRTAPEALRPEVERLRTTVLPHWDAPVALLEGLPPLPGVMQHNDLGPWNIAVDPATGSFTALDWERARRVGFPLWDLWFFLQDALAVLDGFSGLTEADLMRRESHAVRLFRGELPSSPILFEWTRRAMEAFSVPERAAGTLAMLCFLHHGVSQSEREEAVSMPGVDGGALEMIWPRVARRWLSEPGLGTDWSAWRLA